MTQETVGVWESADVVEEGEYLFVYVADSNVAKYGVGQKTWASPDDPKDYIVGNFPWAGKPTHAMRLPKPPNGGVTMDDYLAVSRAQLQAAIFKRYEEEIAALKEENEHLRRELELAQRL